MYDEPFCHASAVTFYDIYDGRVRNLLAIAIQLTAAARVNARDNIAAARKTSK